MKKPYKLREKTRKKTRNLINKKSSNSMRK